jgi:predicted NBD/HSP70 family sugar kinase
MERYVSGPGMSQLHRHLGGDGAPPHAIAAQAAAGSQLAQQTLALHLDLLAHALATLVITLDPHAIVLGGGLSQMSHLYQQLPAAVKRHLFAGVIVPPILPPASAMPVVHAARPCWRASFIPDSIREENERYALPVQQIIAAHRRGEAAGMYSVCCSHPRAARRHAGGAALRHRAAGRSHLESGRPVRRLHGHDAGRVPRLCAATGQRSSSRWSGWCWAATTSARTPGRCWMPSPPCSTRKS